MSRNVFVRGAAVALGLLSSPSMALADEAKPAIADLLNAMDKAASDFVDLTTVSKLIVKEPGGKPGREMQFTTYSKGYKRLVRFDSPGDVKGMGMLIESPEVMYALLPAFGNRVRRLGTHVKNQSFMGSDVSNEDMATGAFTGTYDAKILGEEGGTWIVELKLIAGKSGEFPVRKMWIDKKYAQPTKEEDYDDKGKKVRTKTFGDYSLDAGSTTHYTPASVLIVDHRRNDHSTEIIFLSHKANANLGDDTFTTRNLQAGH